MGRRKEKEAHLAMAGGEDPADLRELLHSLRHGGAVEVTVLGKGLGGQFHPGEGVMLGGEESRPHLSDITSLEVELVELEEELVG